MGDGERVGGTSSTIGVFLYRSMSSHVQPTECVTLIIPTCTEAIEQNQVKARK